MFSRGYGIETASLMIQIGLTPNTNTLSYQHVRKIQLDLDAVAKKLFKDTQRNALFFVTAGNSGIRGVFKYDLTAKELSSTPVTESVDSSSAADDEYIYWLTWTQIIRMKKL